MYTGVILYVTLDALHKVCYNADYFVYTATITCNICTPLLPLIFERTYYL